MESFDTIEAVLENLGIEIANVGPTQIKARCPMHEERTGKPDAHPSWYINKVTGASFCFSCEYRASLSHLVTDLTGSDSHSFLREYRTAAIIRLAKEVNQPLVEVQEGPYIGERVLQKFALPPTRQLERRGLRSDSTALYGVRWDTNGKNWVIPVRNAVGELVGWQEKSTGYFKNVPTGMKKSMCLFGFDVFAGGRAILVESPLDVVRLHSVGITGGIAAFGAMVSPAQMALIIQAASKLVIALDNDSAGKQGAKAIWKSYNRRIPISFLSYKGTRAKDVGDCTDQEIRTAISNASILEGINL